MTIRRFLWTTIGWTQTDAAASGTTLLYVWALISVGHAHDPPAGAGVPLAGAGVPLAGAGEPAGEPDEHAAAPRTSAAAAASMKTAGPGRLPGPPRRPAWPPPAGRSGPVPTNMKTPKSVIDLIEQMSSKCQGGGIPCWYGHCNA